MKHAFFLAAVLLAVLASSPNAQQDPQDLGQADSIRLSLGIVEVVGSDLKIELKCWVFNDVQTIYGLSAGFSWDNSAVMLDSAKLTPLGSSFLNVVGFVYFGSSLGSSNSNKKFVIAGTGTTSLPPSLAPKHLSTYYFTVPGYDLQQLLLLDTVHIPSNYGFTTITPTIIYSPRWSGKLYIPFNNVIALRPLGNGNLTFYGSDSIIVGNIGNSGQDGFTVEVPADVITADIVFGRLNLNNNGDKLGVIGSFEFTPALARIDGGSMSPDQVLFDMSFLGQSSTVLITANTSSLGDNDPDVKLYDSGTLQNSATIVGGGLVATATPITPGAPRNIPRATFDASSIPPLIFSAPFGQDMNVTTPLGLLGTGDLVAVVANDIPGGVYSMQNFSAYFTGIGSTQVKQIVVQQCCIGTVGNIDCIGGVDIADLTRLVDFLFISFDELCCMKEANCDDSAPDEISIGDLTVLVDNLFISFAPLHACQ